MVAVRVHKSRSLQNRHSISYITFTLAPARQWILTQYTDYVMAPVKARSRTTDCNTRCTCSVEDLRLEFHSSSSARTLVAVIRATGDNGALPYDAARASRKATPDYLVVVSSPSPVDAGCLAFAAGDNSDTSWRSLPSLTNASGRET